MPITDDSRRQTRIYHREQAPEPQPARPYDERIGFTQPIAPKRGPLDGISAAQVVAGAAAAATSMLLASKIGIAGSVIGAAVSSAVTIICSQLYRRALEASAEKLKASQLGVGSDGTGYGVRGGDVYGGGAPHARYGARIAPTSLRVRAANERKATQRKVLAVSIALAIAAVAATAGAILLGTAGQGLGARPAPLIPTAPAAQTPSASEPGDVVADGTDTPAQGTGDSAAKDAATAPDTDSSSDNSSSESPEDGTGDETDPSNSDSGSDDGEGDDSAGESGAGSDTDANGHPNGSETTDAA